MKPVKKKIEGVSWKKVSRTYKAKRWHARNIKWRFGKRPECILSNMIIFVKDGTPIEAINCSIALVGTSISSDPKHYKKAKRIITPPKTLLESEDK